MLGLQKMQIAGGGGAHHYLSTQEAMQFKASLVHTVSSRTARAREPAVKNKSEEM